MTNNEKIMNLAKDLKISTGYNYRIENKIHILEIADLEFTGTAETEVFNEAIQSNRLHRKENSLILYRFSNKGWRTY